MMKAAAWGLTGLVVVGGGSAVVMVGLPEVQILRVPDPAEALDLPEQSGLLAPAPAPAQVQVQTGADRPEPQIPGAEAGFDVVRIEAEGAALIAGRSAPHVLLTLTLDGTPLAQTTTDATGQFVSLTTIAPADRPRLLEMQWPRADGSMIVAPATVVIAPRLVPDRPLVATAPVPSDVQTDQTSVAALDLSQTMDAAAAPAGSQDIASAPPAVFHAGPDGVTSLVPRELPAPQGIQIDSIAYGDDLDVIVQGRSGSPGTVQVTLDGQPVGDEQVLDKAGSWRVDLGDVQPGLYDLQVAVTDTAGAVQGQAQTPFVRTAEEDLPDLGTQVDVITVQPGFSLWRIARDRYGDGVQYVQIFEANRRLIDNPDLIYPGQVLSLPQ